MEFKPAKCPSCFGELQVPDNKDFVICMYCGANVKVRDSIKIVYDANVPNWFKIAYNALDAGNYEEAYEYFNKILEIDSNFSAAWSGKAMATGAMTTLNNNRINEMINYFKNSINSETDEKSKQNIVDYIDTILTKFQYNAKKHCMEYISNMDYWNIYVNQCKILLNALDYCHNLLPLDKKVMKNIIFLCNDNI